MTEMTPVAELPLAERIERIGTLRAKINKGDITDEELRYGLELLRGDRSVAPRAKKSTAKPEVVPLGLDEL